MNKRKTSNEVSTNNSEMHRLLNIIEVVERRYHKGITANLKIEVIVLLIIGFFSGNKYLKVLSMITIISLILDCLFIHIGKLILRLKWLKRCWKWNTKS